MLLLVSNSDPERWCEHIKKNPGAVWCCDIGVYFQHGMGGHCGRGRGGQRHAGAFGSSLFSLVMYIKLGAKITINLGGGSGVQLGGSYCDILGKKVFAFGVCIKRGM